MSDNGKWCIGRLEMKQRPTADLSGVASALGRAAVVLRVEGQVAREGHGAEALFLDGAERLGVSFEPIHFRTVVEMRE